jgi:hypothetical protein
MDVAVSVAVLAMAVVVSTSNVPLVSIASEYVVSAVDELGVVTDGVDDGSSGDVEPGSLVTFVVAECAEVPAGSADVAGRLVVAPPDEVAASLGVVVTLAVEGFGVPLETALASGGVFDSPHAGKEQVNQAKNET